MRRISMRGLMAATGAIAFWMAALHHSDELWVGIAFFATFALLGVAVIGAVFLLGPRRAWWSGYGVMSGGYLLHVFVLSLGLTDSTADLMEYLYPGPPIGMMYRRWAGQLGRELAILNQIEAMSLRGEAPNPRMVAELKARIADWDRNIVADDPVHMPHGRFWRSLLARDSTRDAFIDLGYGLFAQLVGMFGGFLACRFYAQGEAWRAGRPRSLAEGPGRASSPCDPGPEPAAAPPRGL